jgi:hypothetical protein
MTSAGTESVAPLVKLEGVWKVSVAIIMLVYVIEINQKFYFDLVWATDLFILYNLNHTLEQ